MTRVLKTLRCIPWSASRCHENWETPTSCPVPPRNGGLQQGTAWLGVVVLPHSCSWFPFGARLMETSGAPSFSLGSAAPRTDPGREQQHWSKRPPATALKWDSAPLLLSALLCSAVKPFLVSTPKSHRWALEIEPERKKARSSPRC